MNYTDLNYTELECDEPKMHNCTAHNYVELNFTNLNCSEMNCTELNCSEHNCVFTALRSTDIAVPGAHPDREEHIFCASSSTSEFNPVSQSITAPAPECLLLIPDNLTVRWHGVWRQHCSRLHCTALRHTWAVPSSLIDNYTALNCTTAGPSEYLCPQSSQLPVVTCVEPVINCLYTNTCRHQLPAANGRLGDNTMCRSYGY